MAEDRAMSKNAPHFKSVYSMGQYDFERFHILLANIDELAVLIDEGNYRYILKYYSALKELYRNWRSLLRDKQRTEMTARFDSIKEDVKLIKQRSQEGNKYIIDTKVLDTLEDIHNELMDLKQVIGLGIEVRRSITGDKIIKQAFGGVKS